jgi:type I restriction enzyme, S subunit
MSAVRTIALRDVAKIERDIVDPASIADGTIYVGLENIESGGRLIDVRPVGAGELGSSKFSFTSAHVLYGKLRPYLAKIARPNFDGICSTDILPILPGPELDRAYLAWLLLSPEMISVAASRATGANLPRLGATTLAELRIPLPSLPIQRRIAKILDNADALRAKRRATIIQLDTLTQSIFLNMFGDPATNPQGFPRVPLSALVRDDDTINYGVVQPGDDHKEGIPLIRVGDLVDGRVRHAQLKRIAPSIEAAYARSRLRGDELLVSCVGSIGIVALADQRARGYNIARAVARIPVADSTVRTYLATYLNTAHVQRYFTSELRTVSQPTLNIKQLAETAVMLAPLPMRQQFAQRSMEVDRRKELYASSASALDSLFSSLQDHAFRGAL